MRIGNQIIGLTNQRYLSHTTQMISRALNRISSGQRITSAQDDSAGLAIAQGLERDRRAQTQGIRNMNNAMSLLSVVDGVLSSQIDLVQRMRELAVQGSSDILSSYDRSNLQEEFNQLLEEYSRLTSDATFNDLNLLNNSSSSIQIQLGPDQEDTLELSLPNQLKSNVFTETYGTGTFSRLSTSTAVTKQYDSDLADFDGDGNLDRVVTFGQDANHTTGYGGIYIEYGNGDGTFSDRTTVDQDVAYDARELAIGDVNGDGDEDIVALIEIYEDDGGGGSVLNTDSNIFVYLGNGHGSFEFASSSANAPYTQMRPLVLEDLNNDGRDDFIGSGGNVMLSQGTEFGSNIFGGMAGVIPTGFTVEDFNSDGNLDLATGNILGNVVGVQLGNGDGTFQTAVTYYVGGTGIMSNLFGGDFDGDGITDLAVGGSSIYPFMKGVGDGTFTIPYNLTGAPINSLGHSVDLNGDGLADLVTNPGPRTTTYLNQGGGVFSLSHTFTGSTSAYSSVGDLNNDGIVDISTIYGGSSSQTVFLHETEDRDATDLLGLSDTATASQSLSILDHALENIIAARSQTGAMMNRLQFAEAASESLLSSLTESESHIRDADLAEELAQLTSLQILQQIQTASQAQMSLQLRSVLSLLL